MEGGQGHVAADEEATPDQRADALHHHPELIDIRWGKCMFHGRSVLQGSQDLKWLPPESNDPFLRPLDEGTTDTREDPLRGDKAGDSSATHQPEGCSLRLLFRQW